MESPTKRLKDLNICVALDTSEYEAVQDVCLSLSIDNPNPLQVLTWSHTTFDRKPMPISHDAMALDLHSHGGTMPSCLFDNVAYLSTLLDAGLWFLFTDGEVVADEIGKFASATTKVHMHGTPCVIVVFGKTAKFTPNEHRFPSEYPSSLVYLKGCFKELLDNKDTQPYLGLGSKWSDLPTIDYGDLANINVPPPKKLAPDKIALQNGRIIRLPDLYRGQLSAEDMHSATNELDSIVGVAMTQGSGEELMKWLSDRHVQVPQAPVDRPDINKGAQKSIGTLLDNLKIETPRKMLDKNRAALRAAHQKNQQCLETRIKEHDEEVKTAAITNQRYDAARRLSKQMHTLNTVSMSGGRTLTSGDAWTPRPPKREDGDFEMEPTSFNPPLLKSGLTSCFLGTFNRPETKSEYSGECQLCHGNDLLALLIKTPDDILISAYAEGSDDIALTAIFTSSVYCDACASQLVGLHKSPDGESIIAGIPLVSIDGNEAAWVSALRSSILGKGFGADPLKQTKELFNSKGAEKLFSKLAPGDPLVGALIWVKHELRSYFGGKNIVKGKKGQASS